MRKSYFLLCLTLALTACERDINLEDYRSIEGSDLLTLNAVVRPDSTVSATASLPYFFSDEISAPAALTVSASASWPTATPSQP